MARLVRGVIPLQTRTMPSLAEAVEPVPTQSVAVPSLEQGEAAEATIAREQPGVRGVRIPLVLAVHQLLMESHGDMDVVMAAAAELMVRLVVTVVRLEAEAVAGPVLMAQEAAEMGRLEPSESIVGR